MSETAADILSGQNRQASLDILARQQIDTVELAYDEHGSLPDHILLTEFGISSEEGRQALDYSGHSGTLAQALVDPKCPLGEKFRAAHQEDQARGDGESTSVMRKAEALAEVWDVTITVRPKPAEQYEAALAAKLITDSAKKKLI